MLSEEELQIIQNILSIIVGALSSTLITWLKTRKSKSDRENLGMEILNRAASDNVLTAQSLIDTLQEMLDDKEVYFLKEIVRAKEDCGRQIEDSMRENNRLVEDLRAKIIELTREKESMSREIVSLTLDKKNQEEQIINLTLKLAKYQDDLDVAKKNKSTEIQDKIV